METRIAQFEKVSKEQFFKDMMDTFGVKYGVPGDGLLSENQVAAKSHNGFSRI